MRRIQRQPQRFIQRRHGHLSIVVAADLLLAQSRQMHAYGKHVRIGRHACGAHVNGAFQVRFGRLHRGASYRESFAREHGAVICPHHASNYGRAGLGCLFSGHLPAQIGILNLLAGKARIPQVLVKHQLRLKIIQSRGAVQRPDSEIFLGELVLGQQ